MKIDNVETRLYRIPLPTPIQAASTPVMTDFDLVMARVRDSDGATGCGYTVLSAGQGVGVAAIIDNVFAPIARDEDPRRIQWLWSRMWRAHHYAGRGGPVSFAIAALDTALWDLKGRTLREPLWRLLGGHRPEVRAYAGNIDLNFPREKLLEGVSRSLAAGYKSIKMRLGKPSLREDVERVAAVRELLGPDVELMADANEAWRTDQALRAFQALKQFNLVWIEEPIRPDDYAGYAHLRAHGGVPIAAGENLHTLAEFTALISAGGVDFPEPDLHHLRWHHAVDEDRASRGSTRVADHITRRARHPCSSARCNTQRGVSRSPRLRTRPLYGAAAADERRNGDRARSAGPWHRVRLGRARTPPGRLSPRSPRGVASVAKLTFGLMRK